jgi:hypothetical protein
MWEFIKSIFTKGFWVEPFPGHLYPEECFDCHKTECHDCEHFYKKK